jgi:hypothetical protein
MPIKNEFWGCERISSLFIYRHCNIPELYALDWVRNETIVIYVFLVIFYIFQTSTKLYIRAQKVGCGH